jgi:hypothetical protein
LVASIDPVRRVMPSWPASADHFEQQRAETLACQSSITVTASSATSELSEGD